MKVDRADAGFDSHVHAVFVQFDDFIEAVHTKDQAAADGNGSVGKTRAAAADSNGKVILICQFDDGRDFLGIGRQDCGVRHVEHGRVRFVVRLVLQEQVAVGLNVCRAGDGL